MITVKSILAPSRIIPDKESEKGKSKPAKIVIPKITDKRITETTTYSTIIVVDEKYISLSITKHFGYQKPYELDHKLSIPKGVDLFEEIFYWPLEDFVNSLKLNKFAYKRFLETDFHYQSKLIYELQWEIINIKTEGNKLFLSNKDISYMTAIPPNDSDEPRYDYIMDDRTYKYGCKSGEFKNRAIEIVVSKK
jgi:hypothetical protein